MSDDVTKKSTRQSVLAVFAGLLVIALLSTATDEALRAVGVFSASGQPMSEWLFLLAAAHRIVYSTLGCYLAARLAPNRSMKHALLLGLIGVAMSTLGALATWSEGPDFGPKWYPISLIFVALPCAWCGGKLWASQK
jgi:4-amino-4-deoxy-L-arabinose transferase-like glycosyltransferase